MDSCRSCRKIKLATSPSSHFMDREITVSQITIYPDSSIFSVRLKRECPLKMSHMENTKYWYLVFWGQLYFFGLILKVKTRRLKSLKSSSLKFLIMHNFESAISKCGETQKHLILWHLEKRNVSVKSGLKLIFLLFIRAESNGLKIVIITTLTC